ncbi:MAPEG family protein [Pseudoalteromonas rhizosphaerae]|uniref:MAPEG family protein n=1 Tax=Pseudoalteromonas rhizosphaerae TaxID=2518973 RepID=UPI0012315754|nr:MAPEG family protein [Pseudoalteromonas rhizosphaerae]
MIVSLYAALLALFYIYLTMNVVKVRRAERISLGDGGNQQLQCAMRAHGNFIEYVPLAIILLFLVEYQGLASHYCHAFGAALLIGRVFHNLGIVDKNLRYRQIGALTTFLIIALNAFILLLTRLY